MLARHASRRATSALAATLRSLAAANSPAVTAPLPALAAAGRAPPPPCSGGSIRGFAASISGREEEGGAGIVFGEVAASDPSPTVDAAAALGERVEREVRAATRSD